MATHLETEIISEYLSSIRKTIDIVDSIQKKTSFPSIIAQKENILLETEDKVDHFLASLRSDWFVSIAGYFINHRVNSPYAKLDDEYKIQDLVYCLGRTYIPDFQYEDPQQKNIGALTSTRIDFSSAQCKLFVEIKIATSKHTAKKVEAEISEDIVKYGKQKTFNTLIFFIYCYEYCFPNPFEFERGFNGSQTIQNHMFNTICIIKP